MKFLIYVLVGLFLVNAVAGAVEPKPCLEIFQMELSLSERVLIAGPEKTLYKFKATAVDGDCSLYNVGFAIHSASMEEKYAKIPITRFSLYAFTDSGFSAPDAFFNGINNPGGLVNAGHCAERHGKLVVVHPTQSKCSRRTPLVIPSGQSRWFVLRAEIRALAPTGIPQVLWVQLKGYSNNLKLDVIKESLPPETIQK